jgi:hypothetical protein
MAPPPSAPPSRLRQQKRKRKRQNNGDADTAAERLRQYGVDLPQIPGLPLTIIPLHVFALKTTTQSFRKDERSHAAAIPPYQVLPAEDNGDYSSNNNNTKDHASVRTAAAAAASGGGVDGSVMLDRILDRVRQQQAAIAAAGAANTTNNEMEQLESKRKDAIATWLNAIHRQIKDDQYCKKQKEEQQQQSINHRQESTNNTNNTRSHYNSSHSIVVAALEHLWSIGIAHDRIHVRRAALHMAGHLLQKSADARSWVLENNGGGSGVLLAQWLDVLTATRKATKGETTATQQQQRQRQVRLWQREGYLLLQHLDSAGYGDFYPCLPVALQRLEQEFFWMMQHSGGNSSISSNTAGKHHADEDNDDNNINDSNNMLDWRKWRDLAMDHCNEEARRVGKLLAQCQVYMDVLVPRVGVAAAAANDNNNEELDDDDDKKQPAAATARTAGLKNGDDDDNGDDNDDDDDVAWEDGFDDDEDPFNNDDEDEEEVSASRHAENVERTLQVMHTAAGLQGGELEINFQPPTVANNITASATTASEQQDAAAATSTIINRTSPQAVEAWSRLEKTVAILSKRHKRRLSLWVNGLMHADGLVQQRQQQPDASGNGSLVHMSRDKTQRRRQVLDVLAQLKSDVARTLSLAKRLGMQPTTTITTSTTNSEQSLTTTTMQSAAAATTTTTTTTSRSAANIAVSLATSQRHQSLTVTPLMRQQAAQPNCHKQQQHRRIQIKYRTK